ncbi:hypothetical protein AALH12_07065 [Streptococcus ferus]|uniref:hypothetical protein n=1 Tax=Streptococcus ferus TaxID=1345 RepID=UPI0035124EF9
MGIFDFMRKQVVLSLLRKRKRNHFVSAYFKEGLLYLVDFGKKYNQCYVIELQPLELDMFSAYVVDGSYIIYDGQPLSGMIDFLIYNKRKWEVLDSYAVA